MNFRTRLILTLSLALTAGLVVVLLASLNQVSRVVKEEQQRLLDSNLAVTMQRIRAHQQKLTASELTGFYADGYRRRRVVELVQQNVLADAGHELVIVNGSGQVLTGPWGTEKPPDLTFRTGGNVTHYEWQGQTWQIEYRWFAPWQWYVGFTTSKQALDGGIRHYILQLAFWLVLGMIFCIGVVVLVLRRLTSPLTNFARNVRQMSTDGQFNPIAYDGSNDEIGHLVNAFNDLVGRLSHRARNLQHEVDSRARVIEEQQMKLANSARLSALGEMAGGIAHEINNPLAILSGASELIKRLLERETISEPRVFKSLAITSRTISRIAEVVEGLRTISRDSSGDPMLPTTLRSILNETLPLIREKYLHHGIEIEVLASEAALDSPIMSRGVQISQVLLNLLNNTYDALDGLPEKFVRIEAGLTGKNLEIRVVDAGRGIPEAIHNKIFQPFFTTRRIGEGTGLGLSISRSTIQDHGGRLELDTAASHTTFVICLPVLEDPIVRSTPA